jgi:hypothetical protein
MSNSTVNVTNSTGQKIDTLWTPAGAKRIKVGLGTIDIATDTEDGAWEAMATHLDGAAFAASNGVVLVAGTEEGGTTIRRLLVDSSGRLLVVLVPTQGALTDRSGTITTGGTRQQVCAANPTRKFFIFNNGTAFHCCSGWHDVYVPGQLR